MAKVSLWLEKRARQDGTRSIKFRIFHQNTFYINSDISVLEEDFRDGAIYGSSKRARLQNALLRKKYDTMVDNGTPVDFADIM